MPTNSRLKAKGRRASGVFHALPAAVLDSENFKALSPKGCKLVFDLLRQLRLKAGGPVNNGDLSCALSILQPVGWKSKESIADAKAELLHRRVIVQTRQGGRHKASLYGFTWWAINHCQGKLDPPYHIENPVPPGTWKAPTAPFEPPSKKKSVPRIPSQCAPHSVPIVERPQ
jgi:hypothetical protein